MLNDQVDQEDDEMRPYYDFSNGIKNPFAESMRANGGNLILLEPELLAIFPDSRAVNDALRMLVKTSEAARASREKQAS